MKLENKRIGFALCGSFCTFDVALECMEEIKQEGADLTAIISQAADENDTRFMTADALKESLTQISGKPVIRSIVEAEPIGPKKMFDLLLVLPATGNTIAKMANGIADTTVTMAIKSHLRNNRPVVVAISTNDALGGNAKNIGALLNMKNVYFVSFGQDDPHNKPKSMIFKREMVLGALEWAFEGRQVQPVVM